MDRVFAILIGVPVGLCIIVYRFHLRQFTGDIAFAEQYLGSGGTYTLFILIGIVVFIGSLMYSLGTLQEIYSATLGKFFM